jgi:hypothetical protein
MKRKLRLLKFEKYFDFQKMDKNKCPKMEYPKGPYWPKFLVTIMKIYRHKVNQTIIFCYCIFLIKT